MKEKTTSVSLKLSLNYRSRNINIIPLESKNFFIAPNSQVHTLSLCCSSIICQGPAPVRGSTSLIFLTTTEAPPCVLVKPPYCTKAFLDHPLSQDILEQGRSATDERIVHNQVDSVIQFHNIVHYLKPISPKTSDLSFDSSLVFQHLIH
jgi:hypothetical protein